MSTIQWATIPGYTARRILGITDDPRTQELISDAQEHGKRIEYFTRPDGIAWDGYSMSERDKRLYRRWKRASA